MKPRTIIWAEYAWPTTITAVKVAFSALMPAIGDLVNIQGPNLVIIGAGKVIAIHEAEKTYDVETIWNGRIA